MTTYDRAVSLCRWINEHDEFYTCEEEKFYPHEFTVRFRSTCDDWLYCSADQLLAEFGTQAKEQGWEG